MSDLESKKEIAITKELARRLQGKFPEFQIYANKCPSRSKKVKGMWNELFHEPCPPLQPEIDIIILEPSNPHILPLRPKIRAIEVKYFNKDRGAINQSFYVGIEQSLALLKWGFDNVALWQLFDETCTLDDIRNYGCKTWTYIHVLLGLPIEFTPIRLIGNKLANIRFQVIQANWFDNLRPIELLDIDDPGFHFSYTHPNPLVNENIIRERFAFRPQIGNEVIIPPQIKKWLKEVAILRQFLLNWLPQARHGLNKQTRKD